MPAVQKPTLSSCNCLLLLLRGTHTHTKRERGGRGRPAIQLSPASLETHPHMNANTERKREGEGITADKCPGSQGGFGSLLPVSVRDCQLACEAAQPACTAFSYNSVLQRCFLKNGAQRNICQVHSAGVPPEDILE